jgi:disulfide bond formation protein DsbB
MIARLIYLSVVLASALLLGLGMYYQYALGLRPCAGTVLTRYALIFAGLFALFAVAVDAGKIVRIVLSACIGVISLLGAVLATQQSWPRHVPLDFATLGVNVESAVRSLPLADVLPAFFVGSADCAGARWNIIGVAASQWALAAFALFVLAAYLAARRD